MCDGKADWWEFSVDSQFAGPARSATLIRSFWEPLAASALASMQSQTSGWLKGGGLSPVLLAVRMRLSREAASSEMSDVVGRALPGSCRLQNFPTEKGGKRAGISCLVLMHVVNRRNISVVHPSNKLHSGLCRVQ